MLERSPLAVLVLVLLGCGQRAPGPPATSPSPADAPGTTASTRATADAVYSFRGRLSRLPQPGDPAREVNVAHEAIPDFKSATGEVVGMDAMTMPFEVAAEVPLDGLAKGDAVRMTLEMRWGTSSPALLTALEKLPAETRLSFEEPGEPAATGPAAPAPPAGQ